MPNKFPQRRQRRPPPKAPPSWQRKPPTEEGWFWYRDSEREETVLHVFDPLGDLPRSKGNKVWKAWDWNQGRLMLCAIAGYQGEWFGPLEVPK